MAAPKARVLSAQGPAKEHPLDEMIFAAARALGDGHLQLPDEPVPELVRLRGRAAAACRDRRCSSQRRQETGAR